MFRTKSNRITQLHLNPIHIHTQAYMLYIVIYEVENLLNTEVFPILFPSR